MLLLREKTATIDGITFFADDTDDNQFWYIPSTIQLATRDGKPVFSLIKYTGDGSDAAGGYINFEVNTAIAQSKLDSAFGQYLAQMGHKPGDALLSQAPYDNGTVNFMVLDVNMKNGTLVSAESPSLIGDNTAIFSAKLTPTQAVVLEAAFEKAQAPAAVVYNLTYTGITPALKIVVEAKFKNVYTAFEADFGGGGFIPVENPLMFLGKVDATIKKLQQSNDLNIKITEAMPSEQEAKEKEWAMDFVKEQILKSFFTATLKPNEQGNEQAKSTSDSLIDSLIEAGKELIPSISMNLKFERIEEVKTLDFNFTSSQALTQSAAPQNFIGSDILKAKKEPPYFLEVNTNDPFFQQINFTVLGPGVAGFEKLGIKAATFRMNYNHAMYTAEPFTVGGGEWKKEIGRSKDTDEKFEVLQEYVFKSQSATDVFGETAYQQSINTDQNLINLDPSNFLSFNKVQMRVGKQFSWDGYEQVSVEVNYRDAAGNRGSVSYDFFDGQDDPQFFLYRCPTESPWVVRYKITYYKAGGGEQVANGPNENPRVIFINQPVAQAHANA